MIPSAEIPRGSSEPLPESAEVQRDVSARIANIRERTFQSTLAILNTQKLEADGQSIEYIHAPPKQQENPSAIPLVVVPGFSDSSRSLVPVIDNFSTTGRNVYSVCMPHGINTPRIKGYPQPQLRKAMALIAFAEAKGLTRIDAVGHSEGAVVATIVAHLRPGMIRNLVLYNPAGIKKEEGLIRLASGAYKDTKARKKLLRQIDRKNGRSKFAKEYDKFAAKERHKNILGSPGHSLREVGSLSRVKIDRQLREIQNGDRGAVTRVSFVTSTDDKLFSFPEKEWESISVRTGIDRKHFSSISGTHIAHLHDDQTVTNALSRSLMRLETESRNLGSMRSAA